jgi:hypothetical protein
MEYWSVVDSQTLVDNYATLGPIGCHDLFPGRTLHAVQKRARRLKLKFRRPRRIQAGVKYGHLIAVSRSTRVEHGRAIAYWVCECTYRDCGKMCEVRESGLDNKSTSCGCLGAEASAKRVKDKYPQTYERFTEALMLRYQQDAKERSISWELTLNEFAQLIAQNCHYCKAPPRRGTKWIFHGMYAANGVDRKNNELWYRTANALPCCTRCNKAKGTMPYDEFIAYRRMLAEQAMRDDPTLVAVYMRNVSNEAPFSCVGNSARSGKSSENSDTSTFVED